MARPIYFEAPRDTEVTHNICLSKGDITLRDKKRKNKTIRMVRGSCLLDQQEGEL
jgi:hypothetical protein